MRHQVSQKNHDRTEDLSTFVLVLQVKTSNFDYFQVFMKTSTWSQSFGPSRYINVWVLADGLELGPGVRPTNLQRRVVVEDVVAQLLQRRLRIGRRKLSRVLHVLSDRNVDFLTEQR